MSFLPDNYKVLQDSDHYTKFIIGENKFRILCSPIIGYEYFTVEKRAIRSKQFPKETPNIQIDSNVKHFWAMVVWNYDFGCLQIMKLTQKTIMEAIVVFTKSKDYGTPLNYDIIVTRTGEGLDTSYTVMPSIPKPVTDDISSAFLEAGIQLEKLYTGENPFEKVAVEYSSAPPSSPLSTPPETVDELVFKTAEDIQQYLNESKAVEHLDNKVNSLKFHNAIKAFCGSDKNQDEWWAWINQIVFNIKQSLSQTNPEF
ncbi:MAG: hypothetical protein CMI54_02535 [Parcubacteria group bacterium]|jgi:hypothetical protein|nr:hypothetical protein [Parcubacteria group bacterium]|tara:strand:+ start:4397 stop:5164 length:768 start_codon:yes stop_codon:yes gene_type:complete